MKQATFRKIVPIGAASAIVATSIVGAAPASATPSATPSALTAGGIDAPGTQSEVLAVVRAGLAETGSASDVAAFDRLGADQRHELASYFLDPAVASAAAAASDARVLGPETVRTSGDFEWGKVDPSAPVQDETGVGAGARAASRSSWGTQWFAFAGIRLSETKVSMSYE